jgi:hypothetical protein
MSTNQKLLYAGVKKLEAAVLTGLIDVLYLYVKELEADVLLMYVDVKKLLA